MLLSILGGLDHGENGIVRRGMAHHESSVEGRPSAGAGDHGTPAGGDRLGPGYGEHDAGPPGGKGAVKSETLGRSKDFSPLLTQEEARGKETARFLDRLYGGSLGLMVSSIAGQQALSEEDIRTLRAILDEAEDQEK